MSIDCKWFFDERSENLVFNCPKKIKELRIIHEVIEANSNTLKGSQQHTLIVEKLKTKLVDELGCETCPQRPSNSE